jgi:hypothetical protein
MKFRLLSFFTNNNQFQNCDFELLKQKITIRTCFTTTLNSLCIISSFFQTKLLSILFLQMKEHSLKPASSISASSKTTPLNFPPHNAVAFQNFQKERTRLKGIYFKVVFLGD